MQPDKLLCPNQNLIFRIVHIDNIPWILDNGLHCRNSETQDPCFVDVGHDEIIERRRKRQVTVDPAGTLSDYVPFYFTPWSVMLYNIITGHNVRKVPSDQIVMIVTQLSTLQERRIPFVFTDRHALLASSHFYNSISDLNTAVDWKILQNRDFKRDNADPGKLERYQAEALVYRHLPLDAVSVMVCSSKEGKEKTILMVEKRNLNVNIIQKAEWFF